MSAAAGSLPKGSLSTRETAEAAKLASRILAPLDEAARNAALEAMAKALEAASAELLAANAEDSCAEDEGLAPATRARLKLDAAKLTEMIEQVRSVAALPDPLGRTLDAIELDEALNLEKISVPVLVMHGDDDQIVPYDDSGPLAAKLVQHGTLKTYNGFPHGMPTTQAETINADLLAFVQS